MPASPKERKRKNTNEKQFQFNSILVTIKYTHPSHMKKMLYNHGCEKQQTL